MKIVIARGPGPRKPKQSGEISTGKNLKGV